MNRSEFMFQLAQLLADMPLEERAEALKFYNNYFDDAGPENEQKIIEELESPQKVADSIKGGLGGSEDQYVDSGYSNGQGQQSDPYSQPKKMNPWMIVLLVLASPFILVVACTALALIVAAAAVVIAVFASVSAVGLSCLIYGPCRFAIGITECFTNMGQGLLSCGVSLVAFSIGIVFVVCSIWLWGTICPKFVKAVGRLCKRMFNRRKTL